MPKGFCKVAENPSVSAGASPAPLQGAPSDAPSPTPPPLTRGRADFCASPIAEEDKRIRKRTPKGVLFLLLSQIYRYGLLQFYHNQNKKSQISLFRLENFVATNRPSVRLFLANPLLWTCPHSWGAGGSRSETGGGNFRISTPTTRYAGAAPFKGGSSFPSPP